MEEQSVVCPLSSLDRRRASYNDIVKVMGMGIQ